MPVQDHLRIAASELLRAEELIKQEIEELRQEETNTRQGLEAAISTGLQQLRSQEHRLVSLDTGNREVPEVRNVIKNLQIQIAKMRHDIQKSQQNIEQAIRGKQSQLDFISRQARALQS